MKQETKLGFFVLVGIASLTITIMLLGDFQLQRKYYLDIIFNDIAGLPSRAKAKISGVEVGAVKFITLDNNKAKVRVWIKKDVQIHADARASIVSTGLIGSKYLELTSGSIDAPLLKDGDTVIGTDPLSFDKIMADVMEQVNSITSSFKGKNGESIGENLSAFLANLRKVSDSLRVAIHEQERDIKEMVANLSSFSRDMAEISRENKENIKTAIVSVAEVSERIDRILAKVERGEGTLGKLMSDNQMGEDLKSAVSDLRETSKEAKRVLRRINHIDTEWDYTLRYDGRNEVAKSDIGLRIIPRAGKFYYLGVSNAGEATPGDTNPEEYNTFNFLVGRDLGYASFYGGVIRKKAGVGGTVKPFWKWEPLKKVEITAEAYDFSRKTPANAPKANVGVRYGIFRWANIGAQLEDPAHQSSVHSYMNLVVRDDDLGYLLGLVGLASP